MKQERAALVAFDNELADLEHDLKAKKQEIADAELLLKKLDHDIGLVAKERASAEGLKESLEKQFTWILDEHQWVLLLAHLKPHSWTGSLAKQDRLTTSAVSTSVKRVNSAGSWSRPKRAWGGRSTPRS